MEDGLIEISQKCAVILFCTVTDLELVPIEAQSDGVQDADLLLRRELAADGAGEGLLEGARGLEMELVQAQVAPDREEERSPRRRGALA